MEGQARGRVRVVWIRDQGGWLIEESRHYVVYLGLGGKIRAKDQGEGKTMP